MTIHYDGSQNNILGPASLCFSIEHYGPRTYYDALIHSKRYLNSNVFF